MLGFDVKIVGGKSLHGGSHRAVRRSGVPTRTFYRCGRDDAHSSESHVCFPDLVACSLDNQAVKDMIANFPTALRRADTCLCERLGNHLHSGRAQDYLRHWIVPAAFSSLNGRHDPWASRFGPFRSAIAKTDMELRIALQVALQVLR